MANDFRAMCAELLDADDGCVFGSDLVNRARTLLDQPVPPELTDDDLLEHVRWFADEACMETNSGDIADSCRDLIARWGRPTPPPQPVAVSERPWERERWCDEQGRCWLRRKHEEDGVTWRLMAPASVFDDAMPIYYAEALPSNALPTPEATNAAGEVAPGVYAVDNRPDYIRCIAHTHADLIGASWCGAASTGVDGHKAFFQNLDHAAYSIKGETRLVPCPECLEAARKQLTMS